MLMKNTFTHIVNYEKTFFDKKFFFEKCDMTSVNLEKSVEYFKIQESLRFKNLTKFEGIY